jgi:dihydrofolate synthase / folylpolyglutamate synthase
MSKAINQLKKLTLSSNAKYALDNMQSAYFHFKEPLKNIKVIHVAGTNGKGSVSYKIAKALFYAGFKVGLFSSPHISTIRERIMIDFSVITEKDFEEELSAIFEELKILNLNLNFFEVLTLLAGNYFSKKNVDFVVLEAGLGGRLDATNVINSNMAIITSISFDHQHLLGYTLEQIANEKAGIIKSDSIVVLGPNAVYTSIIEKAHKFSAPLHIVDKKCVTYDEENQQIAKHALEILKDKYLIQSKVIDKALKEKPQCRFEVFDKKNIKQEFSVFPKKIILDVAHNLAGLKKLKQTLVQNFKVDKYIILLGLSKDKEIKKFCNYLVPFAKEIHLANSNHPRLISSNEIKKFIPSNVKVFEHSSFYEGAKQLLKKESEYVLALGSFYIMHDIKNALGIYQESDQFNLFDSSLKLSSNIVEKNID